MQIAEGADSVPVHWQQRHSNKKLSFTGETIPAARLPSLPQQDNFHDCGLFVLAYADYFLYYLPGVISHKTMNELKGGQHCCACTMSWLFAQADMCHSTVRHVHSRLYLAQVQYVAWLSDAGYHLYA